MLFYFDDTETKHFNKYLIISFYMLTLEERKLLESCNAYLQIIPAGYNQIPGFGGMCALFLSIWLTLEWLT
jgi:hypothetical protein